MPAILVAIPIYNEETHIARVLDQVRRYVDNVLVVDDGSTDRTAELLARFGDVAVITHQENGGYGKSLADAFAFALIHRYEWLITMDCDEQHEPSYIPRFVAAAARGDADIISGTRYAQGVAATAPVGGQAAPADRRSINRRITRLLNERLGLGITDAFCGFKAYCVRALRCLHITEPGYAMPLQLWAQAAATGLRIIELPVPLIYKDAGRRFGNGLDEPTVRFRHYLQVLNAALVTTLSHASADCDGHHGPASRTCG